jgi:hypothetical protein
MCSGDVGRKIERKASSYMNKIHISQINCESSLVLSSHFLLLAGMKVPSWRCGH